MARRTAPIAIALLLAAALVGLGCHRNVEPYDPEEEVAQPDLSRIFPPGAERAARAEAAAAPGGMPAPPGAPPAPPGGRGTAPPPAVAAAPGSDAPPVAGTLILGSGLRPPPGAILFLSARTQQGMPPTAVKRITGASFPMDFELGPGDRMIESFPFAGPFEITARLDADGNAMTRSPGDIQGSSSGHMPGESGIQIVLDEVL